MEGVERVVESAYWFAGQSDSLDPFRKRDGDKFTFEPRYHLAKALVDAETEADVAAGVATEIEAVGILFTRRQPYAAGIAFSDHDPATAGPYHTGDVPYWLRTRGSLNLFRTTRVWEPGDSSLEREMASALLAFARRASRQRLHRRLARIRTGSATDRPTVCTAQRDCHLAPFRRHGTFRRRRFAARRRRPAARLTCLNDKDRK